MSKLGSHIFKQMDIESFAKASGDFNPMHVDPVFARRLITGGQTVHGMYTLLFALDLYYQTHSHIPKQIKVFFQKPVLEGELIEFFYEADSNETHITARNKYGQVASILLLGNGITTTKPINCKRPAKKSIRNYSFSEIKGKCGTLSIMAAQEDLDRKFPKAKCMLGAHIVATIMALSRLVGMSMPGLHSIFTGLDLKFGLQCSAPLSWKVTRHISPKMPIKISLEGQDIFAEINSFFRPAPVKQATIREVKRVIEPNVFSGQRALVIGGSRGLGELTAKCLAVGGGEVHITYVKGKSDADKVQKAINRIGGVCKKSRLNVNNLDGVDSLLKSFQPTHIYYFSSSAIRNNIQSYNAELFDEYFLVYVTAFCRLVSMVSKCIHYPFYVFYPSTVFIETEQKGFAEYINAKRAGEQQAKILGAENSKASIFIKRLPVLKTDQTASLTAGEVKSPLGIICDVLMEMRNLEVE
ncbi:MaoC/PaaZ C-terminal domain-containing protein [bacterium]|nr:MaoC/PaaZ C-terminal domain-containing protein [bacterium]